MVGYLILVVALLLLTTSVLAIYSPTGNHAGNDILIQIVASFSLLSVLVSYVVLGFNGDIKPEIRKLIILLSVPMIALSGMNIHKSTASLSPCDDLILASRILGAISCLLVIFVSCFMKHRRLFS